MDPMNRIPIAPNLPIVNNFLDAFISAEKTGKKIYMINEKDGKNLESTFKAMGRLEALWAWITTPFKGFGHGREVNLISQEQVKRIIEHIPDIDPSNKTIKKVSSAILGTFRETKRAVNVIIPKMQTEIHDSKIGEKTEYLNDLQNFMKSTLTPQGMTIYNKLDKILDPKQKETFIYLLAESPRPLQEIKDEHFLVNLAILTRYLPEKELVTLVRRDITTVELDKKVSVLLSRTNANIQNDL